MKTIVFVDSDRFNHALAICAFAPHPEFQLVLATNYLEALWTLCDQEVALVIVQLGMSDREGMDLLTYLANYRPRIPVLTLSHSRQATEGETVSSRSHLSMPLQPYVLVSQVRECMRNCEQGKHRPLGLEVLLRVLRCERETCILKVKAGLNEGQILFSRGRIIHAHCGDMENEAAISYMMSCEATAFRVEPVPTRLTQRLQNQATTEKPLA